VRWGPDPSGQPRRGEPVVVRDWAAFVLAPGSECLCRGRRSRDRAVTGTRSPFPLIGAGEVHGVALIHATRDSMMSSHQLAVEFASRAALAIQNARVHESALQREQESPRR